MQHFFGMFSHLQTPGFLCDDMYAKTELNGAYFKRLSRSVFQGNRKKWAFFLSFCRLLTRERFGYSSRAIVTRAMKFRGCIARHIV